MSTQTPQTTPNVLFMAKYHRKFSDLVLIFAWLCRKSKLGSWIFVADSQKFILSCVMQATWNKSLNANIVYCVQYLEKEAKVLKFVLTTWT